MGLSGLMQNLMRRLSRRSRTVVGELVVVDGNGVLYSLWTSEADLRLCGGDYARFVGDLQDFVLCLVSAGVKPFFVFDGYTQPKLRREKTRPYISASLPSMYMSLVKAALVPLDVPFFLAMGSADPIVAYVARQLGALVLTLDSDLVCYGIQAAVAKDAVARFRGHGSMEAKILATCGSEFAQGLGLTPAHLALMNVHSNLAGLDPDKVVAPADKVAVAKILGILEASGGRRREETRKRVRPSGTMDDVLGYVSEHVTLLGPGEAQEKYLNRVFESFKVLTVERDRGLRRKAESLFVRSRASGVVTAPGPGDRLARFWTGLCADAEREVRAALKLRSQVLASPSRPAADLAAAVRESATSLRQFVGVLEDGVLLTDGLFHLNASPEPFTAGLKVMTAYAGLLLSDPVLRPGSYDRPSLDALNQLHGPPSSRYSSVDLVGFDEEHGRLIKHVFDDDKCTGKKKKKAEALLFYRLTGLEGKRGGLEQIPGWRRTVAVCFVLWAGNDEFPIGSVFLHAAALTHMYLSGMIEIPENALPEKSLSSSAELETSAFATYEALKSVATWVDALLTLLAHPLPPVRPERLFSGPVYLRFLDLLFRVPLSQVARRGFVSKLDGTLAEDYFTAVVALSDPKKVPRDAMLLPGGGGVVVVGKKTPTGPAASFGNRKRPASTPPGKEADPDGIPAKKKEKKKKTKQREDDGELGQEVSRLEAQLTRVTEAQRRYLASGDLDRARKATWEKEKIKSCIAKRRSVFSGLGNK